MKVISDGPKNDIKKITKSKISNLIKENLFKIIDVISYYEQLSEKEFQIKLSQIVISVELHVILT